jgi:hypothetical protein
MQRVVRMAEDSNIEGNREAASSKPPLFTTQIQTSIFPPARTHFHSKKYPTKIKISLLAHTAENGVQEWAVGCANRVKDEETCLLPFHFYPMDTLAAPSTYTLSTD